MNRRELTRKKAQGKNSIEEHKSKLLEGNDENKAVLTENRGKNYKVFVEANVYEERDVGGYGGFMFY